MTQSARPIVEIENLTKTYDGGFTALDGVSLEIREGEILALLGPNGAGKTTLISTVCGITRPTSGHVRVGGHDIQSAFRAARRMIGLVPQEISLEMFEKVNSSVALTRGLYGQPRDDAYVESLLRQLALWEKRNDPCMALSGGMKRRVLIAKALAHNPRVLFLDEPTAGVDVTLRKEMWEVARALKDAGVTIILTTHYIEEAEAMADRIAMISKGKIGLVEPTASLMKRLGRKEMHIDLVDPVAEIPEALRAFDLTASADGRRLTYTYAAEAERKGITELLHQITGAGLRVEDVQTRQSSLEDIFVELVENEGAAR